VTRVIVIGAGIVGCSAAWYLAQGGADVTVLEAEHVAAAASGRNAGSAQHPLDARADLYRESVAIYRELGLAAESPRGLLVVGENPADAESARAAGVAFPELAPELVEGAELRTLEPGLADGLFACRLQTGYPMHPAAATTRLAELAREAGAVIEEGVSARPAHDHGRIAGVDTASGPRPADVVLVAAGAWSSEVIAPRADPVIRPLWGVTVEIELAVEVRHRLEQWTDEGPGRNFEATPLGARTVLGATRAVTEPDPALAAESVVAHAGVFLPGVRSGRITATRACPRPVSRDGLPLIGAVPGVEGLFLAGGHGPYGISLGPASGRIAADAILGAGDPPAQWDPARFDDAALA
jgi:D-amino-acid dehydrogenase